MEQHESEFQRWLATAKRLGKQQFHTSPATEDWADLVQLLRSGGAPRHLRLPAETNLTGVPLRSLPDDIHALGNLTLAQSPRLRKIGSGLVVEGTLQIGGRSYVASPRKKAQALGLKKLSEEKQCSLPELPSLRAQKLSLHNCIRLTDLPSGLDVQTLEITGCSVLTSLPDGLELDTLKITGCRHLRSLPRGLKARSIEIRNSPIEEIPDDLETEELSLFQCNRLHKVPPNFTGKGFTIRVARALASLPQSIRVEEGGVHLSGLPQIGAVTAELQAGEVIIGSMPALTTFLPDSLKVGLLSISSCRVLVDLPKSLRCSALHLRGCDALARIPDPIHIDGHARSLTTLDLHGCSKLKEFPESFSVSGAVRLDNSGLENTKPPHLNFEVFHRGVTLPAENYFHPELIDAIEAIQEPNAERRRVLLELIGVEKALARCETNVIDEDSDGGGIRQILRVPNNAKKPKGILAQLGLRKDPNLHFLRCQCPSTGRIYLLRIPPKIRTCHAAAAWLAGFDNPDDYTLVLET